MRKFCSGIFGGQYLNRKQGYNGLDKRNGRKGCSNKSSMLKLNTTEKEISCAREMKDESPHRKTYQTLYGSKTDLAYLGNNSVFFKPFNSTNK